MLARPLTRCVPTLLAAVLLAACSESPGPTRLPVAVMQIVSGDAQHAVVGTELPAPLVVKAVDAAGAPVSGQSVNFRVVAGGGSVFAGSSNTNADGIAQERWTLGTSTADSQRLEVRAVDNVTGAPITFAVFKAVALAGPPASVASVVGDQSAAVRTAVSTPPAVRVADSYHNPVPGIAVTFAVASGGGTVSESSRTTNDSGVATLTSWTLGPVVGTNTLTATVIGLPPVSFTATAIPGAPATLAFVVQPSGVAGAVITPAVQVAVQDAFGNTVTGATDAVTLALAAKPGGGTLLGTMTVAATQGVATFSDLWVDHSGSGYTLSASAAGLSGATSAPFDVTLLSFAAVSAGADHSCGVTPAGAAYCWGLNSSGQLGDGTATRSTSPVLVAGGVSFAAVRAGAVHSCGVTAAGVAYCWGDNSTGLLGDGTTTSSTSPVLVAGGVSFAAVSAGVYHSCGVTVGGAAYCWGDNTFGELGDGTTTNRSSPVLVAGGVSFAAVSPGYIHSCGVTAAGAAYCWGYDGQGQLGDGTSTSSTSPVLVAGGLNFAAVSAGGGESCGVTAGGVAYCWGDNVAGELGDGTTINKSSPVLVAGGVSFAAVSPGYIHSCGVTAAGAAYCWGHNYLWGELGDGTTTSKSSPVLVAGGVNFAAVSAGVWYSCGVTAAGAAYCWGDNNYGELGDGTTTTRLSPVRVVGSGP